ncbi:glyoxalase [Catellatospora methionotrophica]|uniref:Glyoxalase n=1 Tax=Catellatospora methionotrophica TaxID=121620 RepID=A0A8J3PJ37_9ACTN|nr:VOC family protein [Catellatospora methionotrophica]GIG19067.1 glyoxalase [Catellatospora methionotrophica]
MQRVTGIGGVFLRARDAEALRAWYATHLGIDVSEWGGHTFRWHAGGTTTWTVLEKDNDYIVDPDQPYMMNFRVDDLDAMLAQLRTAGVRVAEEVEDGEYGRFGWAYDGEDNRFELWQPPRGR